MSNLEKKIRLSDGKAPSVAERHLERALDFYRQKKYNEALTDLDEAIRVERQNPELLATRGYILAELGQDKEAEIDLGRALRLDPTHWIAHYARAMTAFKSQDYGGAITHLSYAQRYAPLRLEISVYLAAAYYHTGNKTMADKYIEAALQLLQPGDKRDKMVRKWKTLIKKLK